MNPDRIEWATLPAADDASVPTKGMIGHALAQRPGAWAIVSRHDRAARAQSAAERITSGSEYGSGYEAAVRRVGNEHRVYARKR